MMAVTTPRETWTDPRIDDLSKSVGAGFEKADKRMDALDKKMDAGFAQVNAKMDAGFEKADRKMTEGFARADTRFYLLIFTLLAAAGGIIAALLGVHPG